MENGGITHLAEVISIEGESYRLKEARERADKRARQRGPGKSAKGGEPS